MELISVDFLGFCLVAEKIHEDKRKWNGILSIGIAFQNFDMVSDSIFSFGPESWLIDESKLQFLFFVPFSLLPIGTLDLFGIQENKSILSS